MRRCGWIIGFVILSAGSMSVAGQAVADGSVAYWSPIALLENVLESSQQELRTTVLAVALEQEPSQTKIACNNDKECEYLNRLLLLDQPICIGQAYIFENVYDQFFGNITTGATIPFLMDKQYTKTLQTGYEQQYGCVNNQCQIVARQPKGHDCPVACLVTPTVYKHKTYHDLCICIPGNATDERGKLKPIYCGPNASRYAYNAFVTWTCEEEERIAGICAIGERCVDKGGEIDCELVSGSDPIQYPDGTTYSFIIPKDLTSPIEVAAKHNGRIIARKPISDLSAADHIARYGPA